MDWLLHGGDIDGDKEITPPDNPQHKERTKRVNVRGGAEQRLQEMLSLLKEEDIDAITKQLMLKGVEAILWLLDDVNIKFIQLPEEEKERLMALHEAKKGASTDSEGNEITPPTHQRAS